MCQTWTCSGFQVKYVKVWHVPGSSLDLLGCVGQTVARHPNGWMVVNQPDAFRGESVSCSWNSWRGFNVMLHWRDCGGTLSGQSERCWKMKVYFWKFVMRIFLPGRWAHTGCFMHLFHMCTGILRRPEEVKGEKAQCLDLKMWLCLWYLNNILFYAMI